MENKLEPGNLYWISRGDYELVGYIYLRTKGEKEPFTFALTAKQGVMAKSPPPVHLIGWLDRAGQASRVQRGKPAEHAEGLVTVRGSDRYKTFAIGEYSIWRGEVHILLYGYPIGDYATLAPGKVVR